MMSMFSRPLALVSALSLTSLAAVAATESSASRPVVPSSRAAIHCLGGASSVPMTADAEQRLPLRLVGDLPCGSVVSILADNQGYTAQVRTEEGLEGYVAHLNLTRNALATSAPRQAPTASPTNGVVRWQANSPGCTQFVINGHVAESITANGATVQVALEDTGWKLRAIIAVSNNGRGTLEVLPALVTLDELAPELKSLAAADPAKLARVVNHQLLLSEASAEPPRDAVTLAQEGSAGLAPAAYQPSTPGYFGDDVFQASTSNSAAIVPSRTQILALALKNTILKPGQVTSGVIWFERSGHARELSLRVSTADLVFDFPLSFDPRK